MFTIIGGIREKVMILSPLYEKISRKFSIFPFWFYFEIWERLNLKFIEKIRKRV